MEPQTLDGKLAEVIVLHSSKEYNSLPTIPYGTAIEEKVWKVDASDFEQKIAVMNDLEEYLIKKTGSNVAEDLFMATYELLENAMLHQYHGEKGKIIEIQAYVSKTLSWIGIHSEGERVPVEKMLVYKNQNTLTPDTRHRGTNIVEKCTDFTCFMPYSEGINNFHISRINKENFN